MSWNPLPLPRLGDTRTPASDPEHTLSRTPYCHPCISQEGDLGMFRRARHRQSVFEGFADVTYAPNGARSMHP